jgi:predicted SAM-dependent methyltransferase
MSTQRKLTEVYRQEDEPLARRENSTSLSGYFAERAGKVEAAHPSRLVQFARRLLPNRFRFAAKAFITRLIYPRELCRARKLEEESVPLKLHLGCGSTKLPRWVNVDLYGVGSGADLYLDLLKALPFRNATVDAIFHEHVLEHFSYSEAMRLTKECSRVLKPGGVLRVGVPDFGAYARSYTQGSPFIDEVRGGRPSPLLAMAEVVYDHGHRSAWDRETLQLFFTQAGLTCNTTECLGSSSDSPSRRPESVYVEGMKPIGGHGSSEP